MEGVGLMLLDYITKLNNQRLNHPKFPKLLNALPLTQELLFITPEEAIYKIIQEQYEYVGIIKSNEILYSEETNLYYEFILTRKNSTLEGWKYLYVPVTYFNDIKQKLPFYKTWYNDRTDIIYPTNINLLERDSFRWDYKLETFSSEVQHPHLPFMEFTGGFNRYEEGNVAYEYKDIKGYYGPINNLYVSSLTPFDIKYPVGSLLTGDLTNSICLSRLRGQYPSYGNYVDKATLGKFTGQTTTENYDCKVVYYLYDEVDDNNEITSSSFLSTAPPSNKSNNLFINKKINYITINTFDNKQTLEIKQNSLAPQIIIKPGN